MPSKQHGAVTNIIERAKYYEMNTLMEKVCQQRQNTAKMTAFIFLTIQGMLGVQGWGLGGARVGVGRNI